MNHFLSTLTLNITKVSVTSTVEEFQAKNPKNSPTVLQFLGFQKLSPSLLSWVIQFYNPYGMPNNMKNKLFLELMQARHFFTTYCKYVGLMEYILVFSLLAPRICHFSFKCFCYNGTPNQVIILRRPNILSSRQTSQNKTRITLS